MYGQGVNIIFDDIINTDDDLEMYGNWIRLGHQDTLKRIVAIYRKSTGGR